MYLFIYLLVIYLTSQYIGLNYSMTVNHELERKWKKAVVPFSTHLPEGTNKNHWDDIQTVNLPNTIRDC